MKKKRRLPGGALAFLLLAIVLAAGTVQGAESGPPLRREMLAPEMYRNALPAAGESDKPDPKAWQKINGVCYNGSGVAIPGAVTRGIDVSEWQGTIDWKKVAASNVDFAFVRIAYGQTHLDPQFAANMKGAEAAGIPVGCYIYSLATNTEQAIQEAQLAIRMMNGYKVSYPVVFDMEDSKQASLSKDKVTELAIAFTDEIRRAGYYPMVYLNPHWYNNRYQMAKLSNVDLWLAWYGDRLLPPFTAYRYSLWQGTGGEESLGLIPTRGMIKGIAPSLNVDIDFGFVDFTKKITPRTAAAASYVPSPVRRNSWYTENGKTYYYVNSAKLYGAQVLDGKTYRFSSTDGSLFRDTLLYSGTTGKTCYAGSDGVLVKNRWVEWKGQKYYIGPDGYAYTGAKNVDGKDYFFDTKRGFMRTDYLHLFSNGDVSYYGTNGLRVTSGLTVLTRDGVKATYYFNKQGKAYRGWHIIKNRRYYFYSGKNAKTGIRAENTTLMIDGMLCIFDKNGVCTRRTRISS